MESDKQTGLKALSATRALHESLGSELERMMQGKQQTPPLTHLYDVFGQAVGVFVDWSDDFQCTDLQVLLAIAKGVQLAGPEKGWTRLKDIREVTGIGKVSLTRSLNYLQGGKKNLLSKKIDKEALVEIRVSLTDVREKRARLTDLGQHLLDQYLGTGKVIVELTKQIHDLRTVLKAFRIDESKAMAMVGTTDQLWLDRAGLYTAALARSFGKLSPDMMTPESDPLMNEWLMTMPGYTHKPDIAKQHQKGVYEFHLCSLIKPD